MVLNLSLGKAYSEIKDFIEFRMQKDDYRGVHLFQHNRLTSEKIENMFKSFQEIGKYVISIPSGDEFNPKTNKGFKLVDYPDYELFVKKVKEKNKQGSPMSIKKNTFPDLARLNVIDRFDSNMNYLDPFNPKKKSSFFRFNDNFIKFINGNPASIWEYVNNQIKVICSDLIECIFDILIIKQSLNLMEFLLFVTWNNKMWNGKKVTSDDICRLISEYRLLSKRQKAALEHELIDFANPKNWKSKKEKRDYHNWKNESQQIFQVLKDFSLFQVDSNKDEIKLKTDKVNDDIIKYRRSSTPKNDYFIQHNLSKKDSFEFDHVVPFSLISDYKSYMDIDNWKNLIYIDSNTHRLKTNAKNKHMFLRKKDQTTIEMYAFDETSLDLKINLNFLINIAKIDDIITYNRYVTERYKL